jgi:hypothetical protein
MTERVDPLQIGETLPEVALPGVTGDLLRTGVFRGRPLLIFVWASW